jgi:hypothetical protein
MSLPVGVCLGDGTVVLLRAQPTGTSRPGDSSSSAPVVVHDAALLGQALESFQVTGSSAH